MMGNKKKDTEKDKPIEDNKKMGTDEMIKQSKINK